MNRSLPGIALFSTTLFASAFLLFSIQPFVAKSLLPFLGGSPMVWNTCVVFFQLLVLAGYGAAHAIGHGRRSVNAAWIYVLLLAAGLSFLPLAFVAEPAPSQPPVAWLLIELGRVAGVPILALSMTAPILQACYARTRLPGAEDPYFLYAASNAGSFAALFAYPIAIEPTLRLSDQARWWTFGYGACVLLAGACVAAAATRRRPTADAGTPTAARGSLGQRLRWVVLAFIPSSLMLGVTTYISTDIAAMPLIWVLPLALYLGTFIVAFSTWFPVRAVGRIEARLPFVIVAITFLAAAPFALPLFWSIAVHLVAFTFLAMLCHGRLAADRPSPERLTEFYFLVSIGGVAGGAFNTLVAPVLFDRIAEYPLMLVAAGAVPLLHGIRTTARTTAIDAGWAVGIAIAVAGLATAFRLVDSLPLRLLPTLLGLLGVITYSQARRPLRFTMMLAALVAASLAWNSPFQNVLHSERTFFGSYHVTRSATGKFNTLIHGTTVHGRQATDPSAERTPLTYYHPAGPVGQAFNELDTPRRATHVAAVGLGVGSLATYVRPGQEWTFFEIDPAVQRIASDQRFFTFLARCGPRCRVVIGDARMSLERSRQEFDVIVLDAFSSDSIPVHLVTQEALDLYLRRLRTGGLILVHISNRYLALDGVIARLAATRNLAAARQYYGPSAELEAEGVTGSDWIVLSEDADAIGRLIATERWTPLTAADGGQLWTDDYSNILGVLK